MSKKKRNRDETTSRARAPRDRDEIHQSSKEGKISSARKEGGTRHGRDPAPETAPTAGAFGKEERTRGEPRPVGGPLSRQLDIEKLDLEEDEGEDSGDKR